jgi:hypothetical protein
MDAPLPSGVRLDGLVLDPNARGAPDADIVLALRWRFSSIPTLIYTELDVGVAPALLRLGRAGLTRVVLERIDDSQDQVRAALLDMRREAPRALAMTMMLEAFGTLSADLAAALEELQGLPAVMQTVEQLAESAGMNRRSLERLCSSADLPSPSLLIGFTRLFEVHQLLQDTSGPGMAWVSRWLGFSSMRTLREQSKAWLGCTVGGLRELTWVEVVARAASWRPTMLGDRCVRRKLRSRMPVAGPASRTPKGVPVLPASPAYARAATVEIGAANDAGGSPPGERNQHGHGDLVRADGAPRRARAPGRRRTLRLP